VTATVRFTSAAEQDLTAAFLWYEEQSVGLGTSLLARVDDLLARVAERPLQFPEVMSSYRRALISAFPTASTSPSAPTRSACTPSCIFIAIPHTGKVGCLEALANSTQELPSRDQRNRES